MNGRQHPWAWLAILILAGCAGDQPTATPQPQAATQETIAETSAGSSEAEATAADAQPPAPEQQDDSPGLAVGTKAPAFELTDQNGESRSLAGLLESSPTALVFYRSADW